MLGAGVQGVVDERSGAFSFEVPLGGVSLKWDSRGPGEGRFGLGPRWAVAGIGFVDVAGGVRVVPSGGVQAVFEADDSVPSGLAGYPGDDVRFTQTPGRLPARADGVVGEREYTFVLRELGGLVSYFDAAGDPVAKLDAHGGRVDWAWQPGHRLTRVVTETGVVTELDWSDPARVEIQARAGMAGSVRPVGVIELDAGLVDAIVDATGARTTVSYAPTGLVSRIAAPSGAVTAVVWQPLSDGTAAIERVAVTDSATGELVTARRWEAAHGLASGWPVTTDPSRVSRTAVTDGLTRVESEYNGRQSMTARETSVTSASGERVLQRQAFTYPDQDGGAPGRVDRPNGMDLTQTNAAGETKTVSEAYLVDVYGRVIERTAVDGTVTTTEYDPESPVDPEFPEDMGVPVGLPISQRTEAPDGAVTETRYTLNEARTAVTVEETFAGTRGSTLTRTGRSEFVVEPDGFVSVERVYPQGGAGEPLVTEHAKTIDLAAGTVTTTETIAAGTELATTTSTEADLVHGQPTTVADVLGNTTTLSYDAVGRPALAADGTRYVYNALNQPVRETSLGGAVTRTDYWATGDRATLTSADQTTGFYWDDGTLLNDTHTHTDAGATKTASYLTGIARESRSLTGDTTHYAVRDRHGNTTELTDPAGSRTARYAYTDYGTTTTHVTREPGVDEASRYPFLYSGEYTDPNGTQHLAVRTYAPERMSFTTQDTLPLQNRYGYANANPITNIDPSGHFAVQDVVHGLSTGLSVVFAVLLGVSIYATGGLAAMSVPSIVAATGFFLADAAAAVIGTIGLVHTYGPKFLQPEDKEPLKHAEYGLLAAGAAGMLLRVAPKVVAKVSEAWNTRQAAQRAQEEQHLLNAGNEIAKFHRGRQKLVTDVSNTDIVTNLHESTSQIRPLLNGAQESLDRIKTAYLDTARGWRHGTPTNLELDSFVLKHSADFRAVDNSLIRAQWRVRSELPDATDAQWTEYAKALELNEYLHTPRINSLLESTRFAST